MAVLVSFLLMQAVPTLLSCLALTSISPLFFVGSFPFSLLFVSLSVLISVVSWRRGLHDGACLAEDNDANHSSLCGDRSRLSSKQGRRSWWWCCEAFGGFQLAMFLTWALLFLLLCMPPMANAESKVQLNLEQLGSIGDDSGIGSSPERVVSEVIWKDSNGVDPHSQNSDNGESLGRQEGGTDEQKLKNNFEDQTSQQSGFHSSVSSGQSVQFVQRPPDDKFELQPCGALVRIGQQVACYPPGSLEARDRLSDFRDCSEVSSRDTNTMLRFENVVVTPPQLVWVQQPLYQRKVAFLTIINSCNSSELSLVAVVSDNSQFFITDLSEKSVAPGGSLTLPVCYLPQYTGAATGRLTIETKSDPIVVQLQGEGVASPYQMHVRLHENSHYVLSLFNPFNETMFVEEVVVSPEEGEGLTSGLSVDMKNVDRVSASPLDAIVIEARELSRDFENSHYKHGLLMRAGAAWELPAQASRDILEFNIVLKQEEVFSGTFQIRVTGANYGSKGDILVYPFISRVPQPSSVSSVPGIVDFGMMVGDQARSLPLVLQNSGDQLVQIEEIYEVTGDPRIAIEYKKGCVLLPGSETEVANVTYKGLNQPHALKACSSSQKIMVRSNSTIGHLMEIPYRAVVLPCLEPPALVFLSKSTGRVIGDLAGFQTGQGIRDLIMNYRLFLGLLFCGLMVGAVLFFQVVVRDSVLPTSSGDLSIMGSHRRSSSRGGPFMKKRDKLLKMWGWGALATVLDGLWVAFGSAIWRKECNASSADYSLPRSVSPAQTSTQTGVQATKAAEGTAVSASATVQAAGRKGGSDKKNNNAVKADQARNSKGNIDAANSSLPITTKDSHHHPQSVKQPKTSKFLRPENSNAKHTICMECPAEDAESVVKEVIASDEPKKSIEEVEVAQDTCPSCEPSVKESPKEEVILKTQSVSSPEQPSLPNEREKRRRKKKQGKHDMNANMGTNGGAPGSPGSPVTISNSTWSVTPPSPPDGKPTKSSSLPSDQLIVPLSPKNSGSVEQADPTHLPKLKVKVLNSLKTANPAPIRSATESPRRSVSSAPVQQQPRQQGKTADARKQLALERNSGVGGKKSGHSEYVARHPRKTPVSGPIKGVDSTDGGHSYRGGRYSHRESNAFAVSDDGPAALTPSASFPCRSSRPGGWTSNSPFEFGVGERIDSVDVVPPPTIPPTLRAPGARITKQSSPAESFSSFSNVTSVGWSSPRFTASPELPDGRLDQDLRPGSPWHSINSLSEQSSGELVYDIWGNHFGNLSQCSSQNDSSFLGTGTDKQEVDSISGFHRLLVPDHLHFEPLFSGSLTGGFAGDISPTAQALYESSFSGFFSKGSALALEDHGRPTTPPATELPDQLYSDSPRAKLSKLSSSTVGAFAGKPRARVPYSPPMGCVTSTFSSPLSTPTAASQAAMTKAPSCSFWTHDNSKLPERALSPSLSLT